MHTTDIPTTADSQIQALHKRIAVLESNLRAEGKTNSAELAAHMRADNTANTVQLAVIVAALQAIAVLVVVIIVKKRKSPAVDGCVLSYVALLSLAALKLI